MMIFFVDPTEAPGALIDQREITERKVQPERRRKGGLRQRVSNPCRPRRIRVAPAPVHRPRTAAVAYHGSVVFHLP